MSFVIHVQEDAYERAEGLAAVLRIDEVKAMGHLMYLWRWVVRVLKPRHDAAPDGIVKGRSAIVRLEAAARWRGTKGAFVAALEELQLITRQTRKIRVKGTEPYAHEHKRKQKRAERERQRRAEKKTKTAAPIPSKSPRLVARQLSDETRGFWDYLMKKRLEMRGVPEDREPHSGFEKFVRDIESEGIPLYSASDAWVRYLGDENFADRRWPLAVFMHENVHRPRMTRVPSREVV